MSNALRAHFDRVRDELRELANALDDHGLPSMTVDNIRRELITLKQRFAAANDNEQTGKHERTEQPQEAAPAASQLA